MQNVLGNPITCGLCKDSVGKLVMTELYGESTEIVRYAIKFIAESQESGWPRAFHPPHGNTTPWCGSTRASASFDVSVIGSVGKYMGGEMGIEGVGLLAANGFFVRLRELDRHLERKVP